MTKHYDKITPTIFWQVVSQMGWKKHDEKERLYEPISIWLYSSYTKETIALLEEYKNNMLVRLQKTLTDYAYRQLKNDFYVQQEFANCTHLAPKGDYFKSFCSGKFYNVSDDSYHYLTTHIIGLGKEQYAEVMNNPELARTMSEQNNYQEGFAYCFQDPNEYGLTKKKQNHFKFII